MGLPTVFRAPGLRYIYKPLAVLVAVCTFYLVLRTPADTDTPEESLKIPEHMVSTPAPVIEEYPGSYVHTVNRTSHLYTITKSNTKNNQLEQTLRIFYRKQLAEIRKLDIPPGTTDKSCLDEQIFDRICVDPSCHTHFLKPPEMNLIDLLRRQFTVPEQYVNLMAEMTNRKSDRTRISFITAASANHFYECQGLIKTLIEKVFPYLTDFRFYIYDLGLTTEQLQVLEKSCHWCIIRKFPFYRLPPVFSNLKSYTWKTIVVQAHLPVSDFVFWMDASVRFLTGNLTRTLETVGRRGMAISGTHISTSQHTHPIMYEYFGVTSCQMSRFRELEGTFLIFHNDVFTQKAIVWPWVACAFAPNCMYPFKDVPSDVNHHSCQTSQRKYGACHRFDQSALSAILAKIYMDDIGYVILPKNSINVNRRGDRVNYFREDT